jgi:uncharacterized protein (TIGR03435 family)
MEGQETVNREKLFLALAIVTLAVRPAAMQDTLANPAKTGLEIALITPKTSGTAASGGIRLQPKSGEVRATEVTLAELVKFAYQRHFLDEREVTGGPAWVTSDRFDVLVKVSGGHVFDADGIPRKTLALLRALLGERFKLQVREEYRERPVYALTMAGPDGMLGPQARRSNIDCGAVIRGERPALLPGQGPPCSFKTPPGRLFANTFSMPAIASLLSRHLDRPVIDRTGLSGAFDIELEAAEIKAAPDYKPGPSDLALPPAAGPTIFVALQEQLGLKLEPIMEGLAVIVIDQAERP